MMLTVLRGLGRHRPDLIQNGSAASLQEGTSLPVHEGQSPSSKQQQPAQLRVLLNRRRVASRWPELLLVPPAFTAVTTASYALLGSKARSSLGTSLLLTFWHGFPPR